MSFESEPGFLKNIAYIAYMYENTIVYVTYIIVNFSSFSYAILFKNQTVRLWNVKTTKTRNGDALIFMRHFLTINVCFGGNHWLSKQVKYLSESLDDTWKCILDHRVKVFSRISLRVSVTAEFPGKHPGGICSRWKTVLHSTCASLVRTLCEPQNKQYLLLPRAISPRKLWNRFSAVLSLFSLSFYPPFSTFLSPFWASPLSFEWSANFSIVLLAMVAVRGRTDELRANERNFKLSCRNFCRRDTFFMPRNVTLQWFFRDPRKFVRHVCKTQIREGLNERNVACINITRG